LIRAALQAILRDLMRALPLALAALAVLACGSPCQDLATRICNCQTAGAVRDSCVSGIKAQLSNGAQKPGSADERFCTSILDSGKCPDPADDRTMCDRLLTPQGKEACGLAFPAPTP
jgi:hypothetical protein